MPIDLITAERAIGRVVHLRLACGTEELGVVTGVGSLGGMVFFESGRTELFSGIDWLHPATAAEAARVLADANAVAGRSHEADGLRPAACALARLFPSLSDENEALWLLLTCTPRGAAGR